MEIEKIIEEFLGQGLEEEAILENLQKFLEEGKITEEDLEKAKQILAERERHEAEKMFGVNFVD